MVARGARQRSRTGSGRMRKILALLIAGAMLSGVAAYVASADTRPDVAAGR
jgi:hypothetical protein